MPTALGLHPRALGIHIRKITRAHVTTIKGAGHEGYDIIYHKYTYMYSSKQPRVTAHNQVDNIQVMVMEGFDIIYHKYTYMYSSKQPRVTVQNLKQNKLIIYGLNHAT